ncbi:MAG: thioester dehydrase [Alysiella sp.]|uniref:ApeP family dehydratase n=1 Tax=Alysiella sp. TaxID=1872483 RepID=UPI0026DCB652|nr:thioester dehydrase [Alysiella sp.]MDO4434121.1 thioester dehydrase [Alysiella sp.]
MNEPLICPIDDVASLLPHSGKMVLLERITDYSEQHLLAQAHVHEDHILLRNGVLPCIAGMEIMAQGVAAWAGCHAHNAGEAVRLGFLLGTRKLNLFTDVIPIGTQLQIKVKVSTQDQNGIGVFDCELYWIDAPIDKRTILPENGLLIQAALNVYSPKNGTAM